MTTETRRIEWWLDKPEKWYYHYCWGGRLPARFTPAYKPHRLRLADFPEMDVFAIRVSEGGWGIICGVTGQAITDEPSPTLKAAAQDANRAVWDTVGTDRAKLREHIYERIIHGGLSPRYRLEEYDD